MELTFISEITVQDASRFIGLFGFVVYMVGFAALQMGAVDGNSIFFSLINVIAAICVLISLTTEFNLPSALIQISWILIGLAGIAIRLRRKPTGSDGTIRHV